MQLTPQWSTSPHAKMQRLSEPQALARGLPNPSLALRALIRVGRSHTLSWVTTACICDKAVLRWDSIPTSYPRAQECFPAIHANGFPHRWCEKGFSHQQISHQQISHQQISHQQKDSRTNGTAAYFVSTYGDFSRLSASSSARASSRGLVSKSCGFGRRFTARGSTRPGRLPTV